MPLESYIVYEKETGTLLHVSGHSHNDAALNAAVMSLKRRHKEIRRLEVIKISDMTTIDVRFPKPELV